MNNNGLVHIYTGDGKGKTSASLGLIMRAYGASMKILFVQFLKGQETSEIETLKKLGIKVIRTDEVLKFVPYMNEDEKIVCENSHEMCYNKASDLILWGEYDMVILDEITAAIDLSLIKLDDVIKLIKSKPRCTEIILTGRNAQPELIEIADYVSQINAIKHPYDKGICARKGIEY